MSGYIALIDQSAVVIGDAPRMMLDASEGAALQQSDAPTVNSVTPTAAQQVSLYQTNTVALRAQLWRAWVARPELATFISGVTY